MKKLKLIYNPFSGDRSFKNNIDNFIAAFQQSGFEVHPFRIIELGDIESHISQIHDNFYDILAVSGGDGTLNLVLNAIIANGLNIPLLIIPSGTANDFAGFVGMSKNPAACADIAAKGNIVWSDVGLVNNKYFINVCGAGLFTHISQQVDEGLKTTLGKLAYYLKSLEEIPNFRPISVRITNSSCIVEENIFLFLTLNTAGTGGFDKLVQSASVSDGLFDFIAFKACPIFDLGKLFIKVLRQDFLDDTNVIYFKDNYIKVELINENEKYDHCDIDGEWGPKLPVEIRNIHKRIALLVP